MLNVNIKKSSLRARRPSSFSFGLAQCQNGLQGQKLLTCCTKSRPMSEIFVHYNFSFFKKEKGQRGQADAVFEVLIAAVLLGFVLLVGSYAMSSLSNTKCSKSIDLAMSELKQVLEKGASSTLVQTQYNLDFPYCFGNQFELTLQKKLNSPQCTNYCPGSGGTCYLLVYDNKKDKINPVRYTCVQISPVLSINTSASCSSPPDNYVLAPSIGSNPLFLNGKYSIKNVGTESPELCIYKFGAGGTS